ncbi:MAG: hypothetical protein ABR903_02605 [Thermodesulfovibrionales bacterium]|jgi:Mn-dependent DtxR family transcriptional regulator
MTNTALRIMQLFQRDNKMKAGMVIPFSRLSFCAKEWDQNHLVKLKEAMEELRAEGYIIITPSDGLELTEEGYNYLVD